MGCKTKVSLFILLSAFFFVVIFILIITDKFVIAVPVIINVFKLLPNAFLVAELKPYVWGALIGSITGTIITFYLSDMFVVNEPRIVRGTHVVSGSVLAKMTRGK